MILFNKGRLGITGGKTTCLYLFDIDLSWDYYSAIFSIQIFKWHLVFEFVHWFRKKYRLNKNGLRFTIFYLNQPIKYWFDFRFIDFPLYEKRVDGDI